MNRGTRLAAVVAVAAALLSTAGCNKLRARDQLNKGVQAYRNANYEGAIEHFKNAVAYDDDLQVAKLYLATAYAQQYVPGEPSPDNIKNAQMAIEEYQKVLEKDPQSVNSLKGIAYLYMNMKDFDKAREYYRKASDVDPNDPELYYSLGVIAWTQAYKDAAEAKSAVNLRVDDVLKSKQDQKLCEQLRNKDSAVVDEGMKYLETAIEKRKDYDDAMAYLNLLYRRKANDMSCDDPAAIANYVKIANDWSDKAMAARKKKAEEAAKKNVGGIVMDTSPSPTPEK
jgi:tetratricopeptide (TPR) repeat protein